MRNLGYWISIEVWVDEVDAACVLADEHHPGLRLTQALRKRAFA